MANPAGSGASLDIERLQIGCFMSVELSDNLLKWSNFQTNRVHPDECVCVVCTNANLCVALQTTHACIHSAPNFQCSRAFFYTGRAQCKKNKINNHTKKKQGGELGCIMHCPKSEPG